MNAQHAQPQPIATLDQDVDIYLDLTERIENLTAQRDAIKARLTRRGFGTHQTTAGTTVTVTEPPRRFNQDRAWELLSPEQQALALGPDAKKIKAQLAPVLLDQCMDEGAGAPRVTVK